jgi:hypothetical protein
MSIEEAQGVSSSNELAVAACTGMSEEFSTRSVAISTVDLVSSAGSISVPTQISNGVSNNLAIIAVTADASNNTDTNGTDLDLALQTINVQFENGTLVYRNIRYDSSRCRCR